MLGGGGRRRRTTIPANGSKMWGPRSLPLPLWVDGLDGHSEGLSVITLRIAGSGRGGYRV